MPDVTTVKHPGGESCAGCLYFYPPVDEVPDMQPGSGVCLRYPPDKDKLYSWTRETYWCGEFKALAVLT